MKLLKFLLKCALVLFLLAAVVIGALIYFKDKILETTVARQIYAQTGMRAHFGKFETRIGSGGVHIEDLSLQNAAAFGNTPFLRIAELHLEYDPVSAHTGKLGFKVVRLNVAELNVVRNAAGQLNIDTRPLQKKLPGAKPGDPGGPRRGSQKFEFGGIGTLDLTLGTVRYTDQKHPARNRERDLDVRHEVFRNIKSEEDLYGVLLLLMARHGMDFGGEAGGLLPLKF